LGFLRRHDSASLFDRAGGLLREGPTGTNVNDFRAILINPGKELM
jgi:hydroxypyruvate reductase